MKKPVSNRQFLDAEVLVLKVDGSAVTTTASSTGLDKGQNQCNIKKGATTDDNLFTITFKKPIFGAAPSILAQPITVNSMVRPESGYPTATEIRVRTLLVSTQARDAANTNDDFYLFIYGPRSNKEGNF